MVQIAKLRHLLIRRLLVFIATVWLPVATMSTPPCCCTLSQVFRGSAVPDCCAAHESWNSSLPCDPSGHSQRRCGCTLEPMTATLVVAVVANIAAEDLSTGWQAQATQPSFDLPMTFADHRRESFLESARSPSATETCVALCRFLC